MSGEVCPACNSEDYGDIDIARPTTDVIDLQAPGPHWVVGVCCDCGFVDDGEESVHDYRLRSTADTTRARSDCGTTTLPR